MVRAVSSQVFVGREEPLSELADALRAVVAGTPRLVLVAGEAGVGKTRLLDEFLRRRDPVGFQVLLGCCVDLGDRGPPFAAFGQALRPVIGELPSETRDDLLGTGERRRGQLYESVLQLVKGDIEQGGQLQVQGTPTFFLNGIRLPGLRPEFLDAAIAMELKRAGVAVR